MHVYLDTFILNQVKCLQPEGKNQIELYSTREELGNAWPVLTIVILAKSEFLSKVFSKPLLVIYSIYPAISLGLGRLGCCSILRDKSNFQDFMCIII